MFLFLPYDYQTNKILQLKNIVSTNIRMIKLKQLHKLRIKEMKNNIT